MENFVIFQYVRICNLDQEPDATGFQNFLNDENEDALVCGEKLALGNSIS